MTIYVSEMPKNCKECPLYRSGKLKIQKRGRYIDVDTCVLGNYYKFQEIDNEIDTCPLQTTQALKQQVREEVVEKIKEKLKEKAIFHPEDEFEIDYNFYYEEDVEEILDQVKGENNVKD